MNDEDWKEPFEENGITLGPEEALRREIEKSKSLKVEKLRLQDEIENLRRENALLNENIATLTKDSPNPLPTPSPPVASPSPGWSLFLLLFNTLALGILLYFLFQK